MLANSLHELGSSRCHLVARTGYAESRDTIQEAFPQFRCPPDSSIRRRRTQEKYRIEIGGCERLAKIVCLLDRKVQGQHTIHARPGGLACERVNAHSNQGI